jgi:acetyl-CoA synthetase
MSYPYQLQTREAYEDAYRRSLENPEAFWAEVAGHFSWFSQPERILDWSFTEPRVEWFGGGRINPTVNCLDRHLETLGDKPAIIWEPNNPEEASRSYTYGELYTQVCRFAQALRREGVQKGDRVCIYMGMVPELAIAILACARIGAVHSVIFGGFSAQSIIDRVQDAGAKIIITADGAYRGAKEVPLKPVVDEALMQCPDVTRVIVLERTKTEVAMQPARDYWWHELLAMPAKDISIEPESMDAEDPLFILYTSGSTGKPKGVVHSCGGYPIWCAYTFVNVFQCRPGDVHFCTADIGWVTGHSYGIYGPLAAGVTTLLFEGVPTWPDAGRFWDIIQKHKVNILYTAPTAIRSLQAHGSAPFEGKDLSSLRVLGSVGEPINEEAWHWYDEHVGKWSCPIVDTWWQTETGGILISTLAGVTEAIPSFATIPLPGIEPALVDEKGAELTDIAAVGNLVIKRPWPGMIRTVWGDPDRLKTTYFSTYPGMYFSGDGALRDGKGNYRITGRVDDVLNVSGHRIGTAEVENAINEDPSVIESAVVGYPHPVKGQGIYAYVILGAGHPDLETVRKSINETVSRIIGPIARPDAIHFTRDLPKTRSGKIMRRILRKIAEGETENLGDVTTLLDPSVVEELVVGRQKMS